MSLVAFEIDRDDVEEGGVPTMPLPGLGAVHEVELWLPALRGCEISDLWLDGTFVERAAAQERLLVLGDSIGQGFVSESPDLSWAARFAREHNLELINQSVGGQVAQPTMLEDRPVDLVQTIILELGGNYRWEPCALFEVERDMRAMVTSLTRTYPGTEIIALTPFEHDEITSPSHRRSCWKNVNWERLLSKVSSVRVRGTYIEPNVTVVDGSKLASLDRGHFADYEHPSLEGHAEIAGRLSLMLSNADSERRREVALEVLNQAGLRAVPVAEALGRDLAEVVLGIDHATQIVGLQRPQRHRLGLCGQGQQRQRAHEHFKRLHRLFPLFLKRTCRYFTTIRHARPNGLDHFLGRYLKMTRMPREAIVNRPP
jgi:hypothetical protein